MNRKLTPDKLYLKKQFIGLGIATVTLYIPAMIFCLLIAEKGKMLLLAGTCIWLIFSAIFILLIELWIKNLQYIVKENSITIYTGILTKIEKNIPNKKVTDFVLYRDLIDRFLGIASIKIQTAGQSTNNTGYEGVLSGVLDFNAVHQDLKRKLIKKDRSNQNGNDNQLKSEAVILKDILNELKDIKETLKNQ